MSTKVDNYHYQSNRSTVWYKWTKVNMHEVVIKILQYKVVLCGIYIPQLQISDSVAYMCQTLWILVESKVIAMKIVYSFFAHPVYM